MEESTSHSRVRVKYGNVEFEAEGERADAQYTEFMALLRTLPSPSVDPAPAPTKAAASQPDPARNGNGSEIPVTQDVLSRVFQVRDGIVSLLARPKGDKMEADALLMLLYGFNALANTPAVTGVTLMEACRQSGVQLDRIDRVMGTQSGYVNAGGAKRGRRYSLNNPGMKRAEALIVGLV
jgi:hypothetical protein